MKNSSMTNKKANRLIHSTSPYLLQHAYNPVDWYPWGEEAHNLAIKKDKPILLSIGYSSCHWCHVMERESFENEQVAKVMNENFVNIKVDREERPDIDQIYMDAIQALGSQGGWPLTVFLTPQLKPIYGGTYFPPDHFINLLNQITNAFNNRRQEIESSAEQVISAIAGSEVDKFGLRYNPSADAEKLHTMYRSLEKKFDREFGGMTRAPKFPMPGTWKFLLHYGFLFKETEAIRHTLFTLDRIGDGGIYDQIGGGFARYSTDKQWHVPHFEKMLYDNGQLVSLYSEAYQLSGNPRYLEIISETAQWLDREMTHPDGGFYSALDADSENIEGKYYVWPWEEFASIVGSDTELLSKYFGITNSGNWEGTNILLRNEDIKVEHSAFTQHKERLLAERSKRTRPALDDKIVCSWNALMSIGLIDTYNATGDKNYLSKAEQNASFILENLMIGDKLFRSWKDGKQGSPGFLEDYSSCANMFFQLYQATFNEYFLEISEKLIDLARKYFSDANDIFMFFSTNKSDLIVRKKEILDNVIPSSNSMFARAIYQLGVLKGETDIIERARELTFNVLDLIEKEPEYTSNWALLYSFLTYPTSEVAITGPDCESIARKFRANYFPNRVLAGTKAGSNIPLVADKKIDKDTLIYICRNHTCQLPVTSYEEAVKQMMAATDFKK